MINRNYYTVICSSTVQNRVIETLLLLI